MGKPPKGIRKYIRGEKERKQFQEIRAQKAREQGYRCHWCQCPMDQWEITGDHVVPLSKGGAPLDEANIVASCRDCNVKRGNKGVGFPSRIQGKQDGLDRVIMDRIRSCKGGEKILLMNYDRQPIILTISVPADGRQIDKVWMNEAKEIPDGKA